MRVHLKQIPYPAIVGAFATRLCLYEGTYNSTLRQRVCIKLFSLWRSPHHAYLGLLTLMILCQSFCTNILTLARLQYFESLYTRHCASVGGIAQISVRKRFFLILLMPMFSTLYLPNVTIRASVFELLIVSWRSCP